MSAIQGVDAVNGGVNAVLTEQQGLRVVNYIWNTNTLDWEKATGGEGTGTVVEVSNFPASQLVTGTFWQTTQPVSIAAPVAVTGTFYPVTQPISAASLPLPTGAATDTLQTSGNASLTTIAAKDFATQTTLALIKAKTDNLDVSLSGGGVHVIVDSAPTSASAATATEDAPTYTEDATEALSQDLQGNLRVAPVARVSDVPESYELNTMQQLSMTSSGRLRVSSVQADVTQVWQGTFDSPWSSDNPWDTGISYV